ncbi:MAG: cbb3-type cytochrome oxidase assembly protein CcoS [Tunicatimonas sp.]
MSVLFLLIGVSLGVALVFLMAFMWASSSGQYDDDYTPSVRMLFDDPASPQPSADPSKNSSPLPPTE